MPHAILLLLCLILAQPVLADNQSQENNSPALTLESVREILQGIQGEVVSLAPAEIKGMYRVGMKMQGTIYPLYINAEGTHLFSGNIIRISDRVNVTEDQFRKLNPIDVNEIPLDDALLLGNPDASDPIIVFTDPHCPFCSKLHQVLREASEKKPELGFRLKMLPFKESSKEISKTIICNNSVEQLEMAFSGKALPEPNCETDAPEKNLQLAQRLGIRGTPTMVMPNGLIFPGYRDLDDLMKLIENNQPEK